MPFVLIFAFTIKILKIWTHVVFVSGGVFQRCRIGNSLIWIYTVCKGMAVQKIRVITIFTPLGALGV